MQHTTNYNLNVVETTDKVLTSITALGSNATSIDTILAGKQGNLTAGSNITINNGTISATDTTYSNATTTTAGLMSATDKVKLNNLFKELGSSVRVWELDAGAYIIPQNSTLYYSGASDTSKSLTITANSIIFITSYGSTYKYFYCFCSTTNGARYLTTGSTTSTDGTYKSYNLSDNYENSTNKVTSLSSGSTDTQYPSAKCVYDLIGDVETILQTLNSGTGV